MLTYELPPKLYKLLPEGEALEIDDLQEIVADVEAVLGISDDTTNQQEQTLVKYQAMAEIFWRLATNRADNTDITLSTTSFQLQDQFRNYLSLAKEWEKKAEKIGDALGITLPAISEEFIEKDFPWSRDTDEVS